MLCTNCKKEIATFFYTQNINGEESSVALCDKCSKKAGIGLYGGSALSPIFNSLFEMPGEPDFIRDAEKKCSLCALTFDDILSMGKVGCPECYNTFRGELKNTLRSIHGTAKHNGLTPGEKASENAKNRACEATDKAEQLQKELSEAIKSENYERAAEIRDEIKKTKGDK